MLQLPFHFQEKPAFLCEDFIVSDSNETAFSFISKWPNWGSHGFARLLYLYGPPSSGKSYIAHLWQERSSALFLSTEQLYGNGLASLPPARAYIVEDIEQDLAPEKEEKLLHLLNHLAMNGQFLLLTSRLSPAMLPVALPDLQSRIKALPSLPIAPPDDALLHALLVKHFADRQLRVDAEVIAYLLARMERSFATAISLAERIDQKALSEKRSITIPLVRELL